MAGLKLICALMLCMLVVEPMVTSGRITCGVVTSRTSGCISYLLNRMSRPSSSCCNGIKALNREARTRSDRQTACRCMQNAARFISGINTRLAEGLPGRCGVRVPYKISTTTNCNRVR